MHPSTILDVWDYAASENLINKGLALASLATTDSRDNFPTTWSLEKRDIALFTLRQKLFGSHCTHVADCPSCKNRMEWDSSLSTLDIPDLEQVPDNMELLIDAPEQQLSVRLPNSQDLLQNNVEDIVTSCIISKEQTKQDQKSVKISPSLLKAIDAAYEEACCVSNIRYQLTCAACEHTWESIFDIVSYLWKEIDQWARGFLNEIYVIARSFGWSEQEIINLSPQRRNYYLSLLTS